MKTTRTQERHNRLFEIAESQQGYFTAKQAETIGYLPTNFQYHVKMGAWLRECRGIYRLKNFPHSQVEAQYTFYALWSRDRKDKPQGVYSHETALLIHGLSDVMPSKLHMTVPDHFRKSAKTPKILKLYFAPVERTEIDEKTGYQVTRPLKTILDLISAKETSEEFIEQALIEGVNRGIILIKEIQSPKISKQIRQQLELWVNDARKHQKRAPGGR